MVLINHKTYVWSQLSNLGLCIASWGLGAEMMYSLNFVFWSSASFFSPDEVTSGFTGSGGFSLLWGPFVQPCEKKVNVLNSQTMAAHASTAKAKVAASDYKTTKTMETWPQRIQSMDLKRRHKLTTMLRKSEKSVVLLLQQDHPWRKVQKHQLWPDNKTQASKGFTGILPSMHHGKLELLGDRCSHL